MFGPKKQAQKERKWYDWFMYKSKIEKQLRTAVKNIGFIPPSDIVLTSSEKSQFGDYSSNIPLQIAKQKHQNRYQSPIEVANAIIESLGHPKFLERIEVAGPGFLNFFIKDNELVKILTNSDDPDALTDPEDQKKIIVEYCDPNTHKMLHIGHLLPLTLGETLSRLLEYQGHEVIRTNYGSDIGLTVAKCLWGIGEMGDIGEIREKSLRDKAEYLGKAYAFAHGEYEKSLDTKEKIDQITNKLYQRAPEVLDLWHETKDWSLGYFEIIYSIFGTLFDRRINESEVDQVGKKIVLENVGKVFVKDAGAIIFPGEKHNLHNRVFINGKGNPTYEGKDVGLQEKYQELFQPDEVKIFSDKPQDDYFKVIIAANEIIYPYLKGKIEHYSYGSVQLSTGKMSSRLGNVIAAEDMISQAKAKIKLISPQLDDLSIQKLAVAAIKFVFLKYSVGSDIVYDVEESVSIHGDTGPYVMYVYARIQSMLKKAAANRAKDSEAEEEVEELQEEEIAQKPNSKNKKKDKGPEIGLPETLEAEERELLRLLEYFELTTEKATVNFAPNELVKYLLNLTKAFNSFYEKHPVIGSKQEDFRLLLVRRVAETIKLGMYLLGIETVDKM